MTNETTRECHGCEQHFQLQQLDYCNSCDGWYCEDCYTEEAEHECIADINEEDDDEHEE